MSDIYDDEMYSPISYFGKENTKRSKRAHETKPKKVQQTNSLCDNPMHHHIRPPLSKEDLEMEPIVYADKSTMNKPNKKNNTNKNK